MDKNYFQYCSEVICNYALKYADLQNNALDTSNQRYNFFH